MNLLFSWLMTSRTLRCCFASSSGAISAPAALPWRFAQSGDMALQRINDAAGVSIILILSDINMPGMTAGTAAQSQGGST